MTVKNSRRAAIVAYAAEHTVAKAAARFKVHKSLIYTWRDKARAKEWEGAETAVDKGAKKAKKAKKANGHDTNLEHGQSAETWPSDRLKDIITYADKVLVLIASAAFCVNAACAEKQDLEGIQLYVTHIKRAALGKD